MRPQLLIVPKTPNQSFSVRHDCVPYFFDRWHYHTELELLYIVNGEGTQFIGDHISRFKTGDVLLIGPNLPHYWRCDENYFKEIPELKAEAKVIHFLENFLGTEFLHLPENIDLDNILKKSQRGILISGTTKLKLIPYFNEILTASNTKKIILLLEVLNLIATSRDITFLSSPTFQSSFDKSETDRLNDIYKYTMNNFKGKITHEEIASVACLSVHSFCRYFKSQTKKTFTQFLIEIRIGYACKLLIENKFTISEICFDSGFNSFSNFNRYFKNITGTSPLEYRKSFSKKIRE